MSYKLPQNAIPFDWEKYKSGKFEAITGGGYKPTEVYNLQDAIIPICYVDSLRTIKTCSNSGSWIENHKSENDLFLIPKTRKVWEVVIRFSTKVSAEKVASEWNNATVTEIEIPEQ